MKEWQDKNNPDYSDMLGATVTILATYTYYDNLESGLEKFFKRCNMKIILNTPIDDYTRSCIHAYALSIVSGLRRKKKQRAVYTSREKITEDGNLPPLIIIYCDPHATRADGRKFTCEIGNGIRA